MLLSTPQPKSHNNFDTPAFTRLPLAAFRLSRDFGVDLYIDSPGQDEPTLFRSANYPITEKDLRGLKNRGHTALFVAAADFQYLASQFSESLDDILADESVAPEARFSVLQTAVAIEVDIAFRLINCNQIVSVADQVAGQITRLLSSHEILPLKLFGMVRHDFYTFTHVTNVAGFAVLLAERLGITQPSTLEKIAVGALLHDLGKRFIHSQVLCKPGKLTEEEMALVRMHPQRGYEDLCNRGDLDFGQLMMVYQHHEHVDGSGYPVGILGKEIHPWARLLAVVDVFDALTSHRPYRSPMSLKKVHSYLQQQAGKQFEREIVRCWNSATQPQ